MIVVGLSCGASCKKTEPTPPKPALALSDGGAPAMDAALVADSSNLDAEAAASAADAAPPDVELVSTGDVTIRVASRSKPHAPDHLIDRSLETAWSARRGALVGTWIHIAHPYGGPIAVHEIRLTAGFTATGPKGEDLFTMHPRIKQLRVIADDVEMPAFDLDVERRDLQVLRVNARRFVRLEVAAVVAGTSPTARSVAMSELEVWGTDVYRAGYGRARVEVGAAAFDPCEGEAEAAAAAALALANECDGPGCDDHQYEPACDTFEVKVDGAPLVAPWAQGIAWRYERDTVYGPLECGVSFLHEGQRASVIATHRAPSAELDFTVELLEIIASSPGPELVVRVDGDEEPDAPADTHRVAVCRARPSFVCSELRSVADDDDDLARHSWF